MLPSLREKLLELRAKRNFEPQEWIEKKCGMLNEYMKKSGLSGCVVNVSGGIDSACVLALCAYAQKQDGSPIKKIVPILQPIYSTESI